MGQILGMSHLVHVHKDNLSIIFRNDASLLTNLKGEKMASAYCVQMYSGTGRVK